MKLFLSSKGLPAAHADEFADLVGKPLNQIKMAHIIDAADVYEPEKAAKFVGERKQSFSDAQIIFDDIQLKDMSPNEIQSALLDYDVVWLGSGNVYYLRYILAETRADAIITKLANRGTVIAGDSAGAIVMGPSIEGFEPFDDPRKAPTLDNSGLKLADFVPLPHWDNPRFSDKLAQTKIQAEGNGHQVKTLNDDQALVIRT